MPDVGRRCPPGLSPAAGLPCPSRVSRAANPGGDQIRRRSTAAAGSTACLHGRETPRPRESVAGPGGAPPRTPGDRSAGWFCVGGVGLPRFRGPVDTARAPKGPYEDATSAEPVLWSSTGSPPSQGVHPKRRVPTRPVAAPPGVKRRPPRRARNPSAIVGHPTPDVNLRAGNASKTRPAESSLVAPLFRPCAALSRPTLGATRDFTADCCRIRCDRPP